MAQNKNWNLTELIFDSAHCPARNYTNQIEASCLFSRGLEVWKILNPDLMENLLSFNELTIWMDIWLKPYLKVAMKWKHGDKPDMWCCPNGRMEYLKTGFTPPNIKFSNIPADLQNWASALRLSLDPALGTWPQILSKMAKLVKKRWFSLRRTHQVIFMRKINDFDWNPDKRKAPSQFWDQRTKKCLENILKLFTPPHLLLLINYEIDKMRHCGFDLLNVFNFNHRVAIS